MSWVTITLISFLFVTSLVLWPLLFCRLNKKIAFYKKTATQHLDDVLEGLKVLDTKQESLRQHFMKVLKAIHQNTESIDDLDEELLMVRTLIEDLRAKMREMKHPAPAPTSLVRSSVVRVVEVPLQTVPDGDTK